MKARYFYAPPIFSCAPKIYILTDDLILYSEIRDYSVINVESKVVSSFLEFDLIKHETEDYPILLEIDEKEAINMPLNCQTNWVKRYISRKGVFNNPRVKQA